MIAVQRVLPDMLADIIRRQPLSPAKVDFAWRTSVGQALARVTTAELREDGTLVVRLSDGRWTAELNRARTIIRQRLAPLLGDAVRKLAIHAPPKREVDKAVHRPPRAHAKSSSKTAVAPVTGAAPATATGAATGARRAIPRSAAPRPSRARQ